MSCERCGDACQGCRLQEAEQAVRSLREQNATLLTIINEEAMAAGGVLKLQTCAGDVEVVCGTKKGMTRDQVEELACWCAEQMMPLPVRIALKPHEFDGMVDLAMRYSGGYR